MKLIVAGATGFVGTELIRQSLRSSKITSVIALVRRALPPPTDAGENVNTSKLKSVILEDFTQYSDEAKGHLADADGLIWYCSAERRTVNQRTNNF